MIKNLRLRVITILVILVAAAVTVYPNFQDVKEGEKVKRLKYGLDIQGGLHLRKYASRGF